MHESSLPNPSFRIQLSKKCTGSASVADPDPNHFGSWVRISIRIRVKSRIRIRIKVKSRIRLRIRVRNKIKIQKLWKNGIKQWRAVACRCSQWTLNGGVEAQKGAVEGLSASGRRLASLWQRKGPDPPYRNLDKPILCCKHGVHSRAAATIL